jgi:hypothetical protein
MSPSPPCRQKNPRSWCKAEQANTSYLIPTAASSYKQSTCASSGLWLGPEGAGSIWKCLAAWRTLASNYWECKYELPNQVRPVSPSETVRCSTSNSSVLWWITHDRSGGPLPAVTSGSCKVYNPSVFALRIMHLGTLVTRKFTRIWGSHSSPNTSEHWLRVWTQG